MCRKAKTVTPVDPWSPYKSTLCLRKVETTCVEFIDHGNLKDISSLSFP